MISLAAKFLVLSLSSAVLVQGRLSNKNMKANYDEVRCFVYNGVVTPISLQRCVKKRGGACFDGINLYTYPGAESCNKYNYKDCYIKDDLYKPIISGDCTEFQPDDDTCTLPEGKKINLGQSGPCGRYNVPKPQVL